MKSYNKTFEFKMNVNVDVVARMLLCQMLNEEKSPIQEEYNIKIVEAVIDNIQDNNKALTELYHALNGWEPQVEAKGITTFFSETELRHLNHSELCKLSKSAQTALKHADGHQYIGKLKQYILLISDVKSSKEL
jgi:hypothetical protein